MEEKWENIIVFEDYKSIQNELDENKEKIAKKFTHFIRCVNDATKKRFSVWT